ncbi:hypothetical protein BV898_15580 [Hypsibius exemplaris]|uniref:Uncharacterized protein n=1 Tax=Hypsibius exemplaris TaxID=2072580 RepID=A0A9X6RKL0_HYPEX|nr:hypothetical protein BV898_15580 [Hypsibius exemplaris]
MENYPKFMGAPISHSEFVLRHCLAPFGVLNLNLKGNAIAVAFRDIRCLVLFTASILAFAYETADTSYIMMGFYRDNRLQVVEILATLQYVVRTCTNTVVIAVLWQKLNKQTELRNSLQILTAKFSLDVSQSTNQEAKAAALSISAFLSVIAVRVGTYTYEFILVQGGDESLKTPPLFLLTDLQEHIFKLFSRDLIEAVRVLYAGYLTVVLANFNGNLAGGCLRRIDGSLRCREIWNCDLIEIWTVREASLTFAEDMERGLGVVFSTLLLSDILRVVCVVGEVLANNNSYQNIRMASSVLVCLTSFFMIAGELISLTDTVSFGRRSYG